MKTIPQILEEFDNKFLNINGEPKLPVHRKSVEVSRMFLEQSLNQILDEMPADKDGRFDDDKYRFGYNCAKRELQEHIKKLKENI